MNESADEGALRELKEETNLDAERVEQCYTFSSVNRDPRERVISIAYFALIKISEVKGGDDAKQAQWFRLNEIPQLAFDHDEMILEVKFNRFLPPYIRDLLCTVLVSVKCFFATTHIVIFPAVIKAGWLLTHNVRVN